MARRPAMGLYGDSSTSKSFYGWSPQRSLRAEPFLEGMEVKPPPLPLPPHAPSPKLNTFTDLRVNFACIFSHINAMSGHVMP